MSENSSENKMFDAVDDCVAEMENQGDKFFTPFLFRNGILFLHLTEFRILVLGKMKINAER